MTARLIACGFLALLALALSGCATTDSETAIPWNRPQPWERQGIGGIGY
jgi:hypothetical protein